MPEISVLIAALNEELTISRAVSSALDNLCDVEVIVVDDGSTDATAREAASAGANVIQHAHNRGPAEAFNTAAEAALGEWLIMLGADDWFEPYGLDALFAEASLSKFVYGATQYWGRTNYLYRPSSEHDFYRHNASLYPVLFPAHFYRSGAVRWHTFRAGYGCEDYDLVLQLIEAGCEPAPIADAVVLHLMLDRRGLHEQTLTKSEQFLLEMRHRHPLLRAETL